MQNIRYFLLEHFFRLRKQAFISRMHFFVLFFERDMFFIKRFDKTCDFAC